MNICSLTMVLSSAVPPNESWNEKVEIALTEYLEKLKIHNVGNEKHEEFESSNGVKIVTDAECEFESFGGAKIVTEIDGVKVLIKEA